MENGPPVVAVVNTSPDIVDMLRQVFEQAGLVAVTVFTHEVRDGKVDIETFMRQHDPRAIVYDIAPPYDSNWQLFLHMCRLPAMKGREFVLTSTNSSYVKKLVAKNQPVYEIIGKPYDLGEIVRAVKEAVRARPVR